MRSLLNTAGFFAVCRRISSEVDDKVLALRWLNEADRLANAFRDYQLPLIHIRDADLDSAVTVFARLNRTGRKMSSLDRSIYDACYPDHLVLPLASCEAVIHAVASMRANAALTRVTCHGIVDGDHRSADEIDYLHGRGVVVLPVAELENIFLLPEISRAIAAHEAHEGDGLDARLNDLRQAVFEGITSSSQKRATVLQYVTRQVDRLLKRIDLSAATSVEEIETSYANRAGSIAVGALASLVEHQIDSAIQADDLPALLVFYDNKGLLALAANHLKDTDLSSFKAWLERIFRKGSAPELTMAIRHALPDLP